MCLINFAPGDEELEEKLLEAFILLEDPELHEQKQTATEGATQNRKQLKDLEEQILHVLTATKGNILESERAIQILSNAKKVSDEVYSKQKSDKKIEMGINRMREHYRTLASHGVRMFKCLLDVEKLNTMYQFSLKWYMDLFKKVSIFL